MALKQEFSAARAEWALLTIYQKFEHAVIVLLTGLIAVVVLLAVWNLVLKILSSVLSTTFDPSEYAVFQAIFGMIFTVIIALEFKKSLLVVAERRESVVQVQTVILLALLAILRKLLILDIAETEPLELFALAAAIVSLGSVFWLVRGREQRARDRGL